MKEITAILILLTLLTSCGEQRKTAENTVTETSGITAENSNIGEISYEVTTTCSDMISPIRNGMKRVRKKESSFILASQNVEDFLLPEIKEFTKPLFSIPTYSFLFHPGNISPVDFMEALQLLRSEYSHICYSERGTCVFRCGNERYLLQVHAPSHKEVMFGKAGGR